MEGPMPVHDSTTQILALCAATRYIADAVASHAKFGLNGEPYAALQGMLASGIHCTIAVREHALASAAQGSSSRPPPLQRTSIQKLQRATVQAIRYKRQPQTPPDELASTQQIRDLLDPVNWPHQPTDADILEAVAISGGRLWLATAMVSITPLPHVSSAHQRRYTPTLTRAARAGAHVREQGATTHRPRPPLLLHPPPRSRTRCPTQQHCRRYRHRPDSRIGSRRPRRRPNRNRARAARPCVSRQREARRCTTSTPPRAQNRLPRRHDREHVLWHRRPRRPGCKLRSFFSYKKITMLYFDALPALKRCSRTTTPPPGKPRSPPRSSRRRRRRAANRTTARTSTAAWPLRKRRAKGPRATAMDAPPSWTTDASYFSSARWVWRREVQSVTWWPLDAEQHRQHQQHWTCALCGKDHSSWLPRCTGCRAERIALERRPSSAHFGTEAPTNDRPSNPTSQQRGPDWTCTCGQNN